MVLQTIHPFPSCPKLARESRLPNWPSTTASTYYTRPIYTFRKYGYAEIHLVLGTCLVYNFKMVRYSHACKIQIFSMSEKSRGENGIGSDETTTTQATDVPSSAEGSPTNQKKWENLRVPGNERRIKRKLGSHRSRIFKNSLSSPRKPNFSSAAQLVDAISKADQELTRVSKVFKSLWAEHFCTAHIWVP